MLEVLKNAGWFVVAIGVLVAFHEYGHFWVARRLGVKVLRFSVGFGKPLLMRKAADGCEYVIAAVPLGGYVKMLDEHEGEVAPEDLPQAFNRQPPWKRFLIIAAGPIANLLLAVAFFWVVLVIGQPGLKPVITAPPAGSVAAAAGLKQGEVIELVNGEPVATWSQLRTLLLEQVVNRSDLSLKLRSSVAADASSRNVTLPLGAVRMEPAQLFNDLGLAPFSPELEPVLSEVMPGGAAAQAGFLVGDRLLSRDGEAIANWQSWAAWVRAHPGAVVTVGYQRGGETLSKQLIIATISEGGSRFGRFGAGVSLPPELRAMLSAEERLPPLAAVPAAFEQTWRMSMLTVKMFGRMFTGEVSVKNVSGPLQIAEAAGFTASIGAAAFFSFLALVSVSLGVLNLMPVPLLDGGHLLFTSIEMLRGKPLSEQAQLLGQKVGITFLVLLMSLAFYNDLSRLFG